MTCVFRFTLKLSSETFLDQTTIQRGTAINLRIRVKCQNVTEVNKTEFSRQDLIKFPSIKLHTNTIVGAKLFKVDIQAGGLTDGETDLTK